MPSLPAPMQSNPNSAVRVLCYGDSLTAGYHGSMVDYSPYAKHLGQTLGVAADAVGMSGWRTDQMVANRKNPMCVDVFNKMGPGIAVQLQKHKYDFCIILAGTNDLGTNRPADQILGDLKTLHRNCHGRGIRTVAIAIPESGCLADPSCQNMAFNRHRVNSGLSDWAARKPQLMMYVDLNAVIPFSPFSGNWEADGLHMSRQGYATFGRTLGTYAKNFITSVPSQMSQPHRHRSSSRITGRQAFGDITNQVHGMPTSHGFHKLDAGSNEEKATPLTTLGAFPPPSLHPLPMDMGDLHQHISQTTMPMIPNMTHSVGMVTPLPTSIPGQMVTSEAFPSMAWGAGLLMPSPMLW